MNSGKASWEDWKGFIIALLYGVVSISITFFNKAVFSLYSFNASNSLTLGQIVFSIVFLELLRKGKMLEYESFRWETAQQLISLSLAFCGMVITGLSALIYVNVPMYSALRRLTTFIVIAFQYFWMRKTVSRPEFQSVVLMVVGALIASYGDISFDLWGYFLTTINCAVTAAYLVLIAIKSKETGLKTFALMYYNNILSLPIVLIVVYLTEYDILVNFTMWSDIGFQFCFILSSVLAFMLNYLVFLCSTVNSPLTTSITGQLKSILQTLVGMFTFGGVTLTVSLAIGLGMSTIGGIWYGQVKYEEQMNNIKQQQNHQIQSIEIHTDKSTQK